MIAGETLNLFVLLFFALFYIVFIFVKKRNYVFPFEETVFVKEKTSARLAFFDFAKGIAILAVFFIHVSFFMASFGDKFSLSFLEVAEQINRFCRFAIPVFLLSSGALLTLSNLSKDNLKRFYSSKIKRIFIPYLFFSFLATGLAGRYKSAVSYIFIAIKDLFSGEALVPFWFVPVLFQLYLLYPLLWYFLITKKIRPPILLLFSFVFSFGCYLLSFFWQEWHSLFGNWFFGPFLFFFVLGMVLKPLLLSESREWLKRIHFLFWTILVIILYFSIGRAFPQETYYNNRFIYGPTIFLLLWYFYPVLARFGRIFNFFQKLGENSLYFYLIHFFILASLARSILVFSLFSFNPYLLYACLVFFGFLISWLLSLAAKNFYGLLSRDIRFLQ